MKIPLIKPYLPVGTKEAVGAVLDSGYLTEGPVTREFERHVEKYLGCRHAIAVTSCTTGLEIALRAVGIGAGDEVIVPDYTYPATASVIPIVGATAVLVDICPETMLIDYDVIESAITPKTKAIIPVSGFGNPLDYDRLNRIKEGYNLSIIEDAACSFGAEYRGTRVGTLADISVFSCHPRKFLTTGEGGVVTTENTALADWMTSYKHFGMSNHPSERGRVSFERIGTNYKLSNILSAVGLEQLKIADKLLARRQELAARYVEMLENIDGIEIPKTTKDGVHSYQTFLVWVKNRDAIIATLREKGIETQIGTYALHKHEAFVESKRIRQYGRSGNGEFPNSSWAFEHCLALPLYFEMTEDEQTEVISSLCTALLAG